ncbi:MAG: hypothetical protein GX541_01340, partial [Clostridiales bacterium]|nr:hypothetical protein [Clostridiales bacterium]
MAVVLCLILSLFPAIPAAAATVYNYDFTDGASSASNCKASIGVEGTTHAGTHALWGYAVSAYIAPTETRNNQWFYVNLGELPAGGYEGSIQINRVVAERGSNIKTAAYVVTKAEFDAKGAYGAIQDKTPAIMPASLPSGTGYSTVNLADFDVPETGECLILFVGTDPWVGQDHEVNLAERTFFLGMAEIREKTLEPFSYAAFSESSKNIPVGKTAAPKLLLYRANDFAMSKDGAVISYSLSDVSPAGAFTIVDAAAGRVRANVKNGTAVLTAEVTVGAVTKYASINLTATDYTGETLTYDYNGYISLDYARDATLPEVGPDFFYKAYPDKPRCGIVMNPRTAPTESRDYHWVYINLGELDTGRYSGSLRVTSAYSKTSESVSAAAYLVTKAEFDAKGAYGAIQGKTPVNIPTDMASHTDMRTLTLSGIEVSDREECLLLFLGTDAAGDNRSFQVNRFCVDRLFLQSSKPQALSRVEFTPAKTTLEASESVSSQVFAYTSIGEEIDDLDLDISYSSANTDVATVDENGNITGVAGGQADITASVTVDGVTFSDTITITVSGAPALTSLTLISPPTKTTYIVGEELDLTGLVVNGTYTDGSTGAVNVTSANISGFDSLTDYPSQTVTVTVDGKTATFDVKIVRVLDSISATGKITIDGYADEPAWEIN